MGAGWSLFTVPVTVRPDRIVGRAHSHPHPPRGLVHPELRRTPLPRSRVNSLGCPSMEQVTLLAVLILAAAILYSSVGHAGASGYLAAMALVGVAPDVMKP